MNESYLPVEPPTAADEPNPRLGPAFWRHLRVVIVAGVPTGMLIGGVGSRLAMFVLRLTSPDFVRGVKSDDGFVIGRFSVGDSYSLLQLGAAVGVIGAALYLVVRPWLLGPQWFRYTSVGLGCGAVVGSMLLHSDGVDFRLLEPRWLAMALFIAVPAVFGAAIGAAVDAVERRPPPVGRWQFVSPAIALALGPGAVFALTVAVPLTFVYVIGRVAVGWEGIPATVRVVVRAVWLSVATLGLVALLNDISEINAI